MSEGEDTVSIDIHTTTERVVGDRVHVVFDEDGRPRRLTLEPGGEWTVTAIEPFEATRLRFGPSLMGARITLRRGHTTA